MSKIFRLVLMIVLKFFFKFYFFVFGNPKRNSRIEELAGLYEKEGFTSWFAKIRLWDAPFEKLDRILPRSGSILDLGCGDGIVTNYLALSSSRRKITGIELNGDRVRFADRGLKNTKFVKADVIRSKLDKNVDVILMVHLLHHLPSFEDQEEVIKNCYRALKKNGKLVIAEVDIKPTFKYLISWVTDHFIVPLLFEKRFFEPHIYFRKRRDWIKLLGSLGFSCKAISAESGKPFTHIILECTKR